MKTRKIYAGSIAAMTMGLSALSGWDGCGHEAVATIAYEQLPAAVKAKVDKVFADDPRGRTFIDASTWADDIKGGLRNDPPSAPLNKSWHFVDIPYTASAGEIEDVVSNGGVAVNVHIEKTANVVTAISFYANYLKAGHGTKLARADALSFLIHFVGDVHQPLHCVTVLEPLPNYTPPASGDLGGNGFAIEHPTGELHALWDDSFDEPTDKKGTGRDASLAHAKQVADSLRQKFQSTPDQIADDDPADWAKESYSYRQFAYGLPEDPNSHTKNKSHTVSPDYLAQQQQIAGARIVLAGDRLAAVLAWIYGN
jgi:S1/P1 Nuclease